MKQKLISKLKRVALVLFAALCVGNVCQARQAYIGAIDIEFNIEDKELVVYRDIYLDTKAKTWTMKYVYSYEGESGTVCNTNSFTLTNPVTANWTLDIGKNTINKLDDFVLGSDLTVESWFEYGGAKPKDSDLGGEGNYRTKTIKTAFVILAECNWLNNPKKFVVSGVSGSPQVEIKYAIGDSSLSASNAEFVTETVDVSASKFSLEIDYTNEQKIIWAVSAILESGSKTAFKVGDDEIFERNRKDDRKTMYIWTGSGDGTSWTDVGNWTSEASSYYGYPGTFGGVYYTQTRFNQNAEVDLGEGSYGFVDDGAFSFAPNITVKFKNGILCGTFGNFGNDNHKDAIGAEGATIIFEDVRLYSCKENDDDFSDKSSCDFTPYTGTTVIFEGDHNKDIANWEGLYWRYRPQRIYDNTKMVFRNGEIRCGYSSAENYKPSFSGSHTVEITNALWRINTSDGGADYGLADTIVFRDGVGTGSRQARLLVHNSSSNKDGKIKLPSVIDIKLPATPYSDAYIQAFSLVGTPNSTIKIDATDYVKGAKVPLIKLTEASTYIPTLNVFVNGEETTARNAKLVWNETAKTLYFQQDSQNAASIGTAEYPTLGAALEAAADGATIKVLNDVEITSYLQITKSLTLNLNGKSITRTDSTDNSTALFVNAAGATVTITGNGTVTADHAVYVNAGKVVIENGTFSAGSHAVYVINNGNAEIKGGTFSSEVGQYHYALNEYDQTRDATSIVVTGGTFVGFNPANNTAEGDNTNFCADGYTAVAGEVEGTWVVQKAISELKPGIPVTNISATTEEEAISKVKLTVEVPANANVTKDDYANYFKLVATETSEGSGVWEVAAVLDDTKVTPVIAETTPAITFKDGEVTVNIKNELPGLYYGVRYATTVEAVETTAPVAGFTVTPDEGDTAGFFKVVVDFKPIPEAE